MIHSNACHKPGEDIQPLAQHGQLIRGAAIWTNPSRRCKELFSSTISDFLVGFTRQRGGNTTGTYLMFLASISMVHTDTRGACCMQRILAANIVAE